MKKILLVGVLVSFAAVTALFAQCCATEKKADSKATTICVCDKCSKTALKAGKCCEQDMSAKTVLAVKDGNALCCSCAPGCKCALKEGDAAKCSCDKDVSKVSLKGMFVCEKCNVISDKEGKCSGCGGDLKAVAAAPAAPAAP